MQHQSLSNPSESLSFEAIVPQTTSNAHVAAAALYHCLGTFFLVILATWDVNNSAFAVLGTKDLIRLQQLEAYGPIFIGIKS